MIDLHTHILPGIDDGARDLAAALAMADAFASCGVELVACTPHILPGLYHNNGPDIRLAVNSLQAEIDRAGIPLVLTTGADVHLAPDLIEGLRMGTVLTIADSRYLLLEPPHHLMPARFEEAVFDLQAAGYIPIITHPERLSWIRNHYDVLQRLSARGALMQITSGSVTGKFGRSALYWSERMLDEGLVDILASDAHDTETRRPDLAEGLAAVAKRLGLEEATAMVAGRPLGIVENLAPELLPRVRSKGVHGTLRAGPEVNERRGTEDARTRSSARVSDALHRIGRRLRKLF
jgi:protein-tyrosine phosphatase